MRVAIVSHLYPTAGSPVRGLFVREQAEAIARQGAQVGVFSPQYESTPTHVAGDPLDVTYGRLAWHRGVPSQLNVLLARGQYRRWLDRQLDASPVDVVHAHYGFPDGVAAVQSARAHALPVVVTLHGSDVNVQLRRPVVGRRVARSLARADAVVCVSEAMPEVIQRIAPELASRCQVVPNGFNRLEIRYEADSARDTLLFVGSLRAVKDPLLLVEAYARVAGLMNASLTLVGDGPLHNALVEKIAEIGLGERIRLVGPVEHSRLNDFYARAIALVLPSRSEGLPIVSLEALGSGVPVVATAVGALPSLITDGENGYLVRPGDVDDLSVALLRVTSHVWDRAALAASGSEHTWDVNARRMMELYTGIARAVG